MEKKRKSQIDPVTFLFDLILYIPVNNLSVMWVPSSCLNLGTKQELMCLAQGHNALTPMRLEPTTPQSRVKHSTTEPPCSLEILVIMK